MKRMLVQVPALVLAIGLLGGCATQASNEQITEIRSMAEEAQATADNASSQASRALSTANQALDTARRANSTANEAMDCCEANSDKIDRMFEKAMSK